MRKSERYNLARKKRDELEQLENETRTMEQRLKLLKSALHNNSLKNGTDCAPEAIWSSSKQRLHQTQPVLTTTLDLNKTRIRTLKRSQDEVNLSPSPNPSGDNAYGQLVQKLLLESAKSKNAQSEAEIDLLSSVKCGQCEAKTAAVACQECNEEYCARCFAQFHMKGALRRHHSIPISCTNKRTSHPIRKKMEEETFEPFSEDRENPSPKSKSVTDATQDEGCQVGRNQIADRTETRSQTTTEAEAQQPSFKHAVETESRGTSAERHASPAIQFTPSLSYAEQLMLRAHRRRQSDIGDINRKTNEEEKQEDKIEVTDVEDENLSLPVVDFEQLHYLATADLNLDDLGYIPTPFVMPSNAWQESGVQGDPKLNQGSEGTAVQDNNPSAYEHEICDLNVNDSNSVCSINLHENENNHDSTVVSVSNSVWSPQSIDRESVNKNDLDTINMIRRHLNLLNEPFGTASTK